MRNLAFVFTAELSTIHSCISQLTERPPELNYILLSDSLSCLLSLQDPHSTNRITQRIHVTLQTLSSTQSSVTFIWIPEVTLVSLSMMRSTLQPKIPLTSLKNHYRSSILTIWRNQCKNIPNNNCCGQVRNTFFCFFAVIILRAVKSPPQYENPAMRKSVSPASRIGRNGLLIPTSHRVFIFLLTANTVAQITLQSNTFSRVLFSITCALHLMYPAPYLPPSATILKP